MPTQRHSPLMGQRRRPGGKRGYPKGERKDNELDLLIASKKPIKSNEQALAMEALHLVIERYALFEMFTGSLNLTQLQYKELPETLWLDPNTKLGAETMVNVIQTYYPTTSHFSYGANALKDPSNLLIALAKSSLNLVSINIADNPCTTTGFVSLLKQFPRLQSVDLRGTPLLDKMTQQEKQKLRDQVAQLIPGLLYFSGTPIEVKRTSLPWFKPYPSMDESTICEQTEKMMKAFYAAISCNLGVSPMQEQLVKFYTQSAKFTITWCGQTGADISRWSSPKSTMALEPPQIRRKFACQSFNIAKAATLSAVAQVQQTVICGPDAIASFLIQTLLQPLKHTSLSFYPIQHTVSLIGSQERLYTSLGKIVVSIGAVPNSPVAVVPESEHPMTAFYFHRSTVVALTTVGPKITNDVWMLRDTEHFDEPHWTIGMAHRKSYLINAHTGVDESMLEDCLAHAESDRMLNALLEIVVLTQLRASMAVKLWEASGSHTVKEALDLFIASLGTTGMEQDFFYPGGYEYSRSRFLS